MARTSSSERSSESDTDSGSSSHSQSDSAKSGRSRSPSPRRDRFGPSSSISRSRSFSCDRFDAQDRMIKRLGKTVTNLLEKMEKVEAILKDVAVLYKFEDERVFSLNDVSFTIDCF